MLCNKVLYNFLDKVEFSNFRYFSELELNYTRKNLERTKDAIVRLSPKHPEGPESASWPIGKYKK